MDRLIRLWMLAVARGDRVAAASAARRIRALMVQPGVAAALDSAGVLPSFAR
jgi:hypothetical protein